MSDTNAITIHFNDYKLSKFVNVYNIYKLKKILKKYFLNKYYKYIIYTDV